MIFISFTTKFRYLGPDFSRNFSSDAESRRFRKVFSTVEAGTESISFGGNFGCLVSL